MTSCLRSGYKRSDNMHKKTNVHEPAPFKWEHQAFDCDYLGMGCTGYTGLDAHTITHNTILPAVRAQIGPRGYYKAGLALLPNGKLIAAPVDAACRESAFARTIWSPFTPSSHTISSPPRADVPSAIPYDGNCRKSENWATKHTHAGR